MKVNYQSGEICASGLDVYVAGFVPFGLSRDYSSSQRHRGSLGPLWSCSIDLDLSPEGDEWQFTQGGDVHAVRSQGPGVDPWKCADEMLPHLDTRNPDRLILITAERRRIVFGRTDDEYRAERIEDLYGRGWDCHYANGRLAQLQDDLGRTVQLTHGPGGLLSRVSLAWPAHSFSSVDVMRYEYDSKGRLVAALDAVDNSWTYEYVDDLLVCERNPVGGAEYASYDDQRRCVATWRSDGSRVRQLSYHAAGRATRVVNGLGRQWIYTYNEQGQLTRRSDPEGGVRQTHYDADGGVLAHVGADADGMCVVDRGQGIREITHANGAMTTVTLSPTGKPLQMVDANGGKWQWRYDEHDELVDKQAPTGAITGFQSPRGALEQVHYPNGAVLRQVLDPRTGAISFSDAEGSLGRLEFDTWGLLHAITDGSGRRVEFLRDAAGRATRVTDHQGWSIDYTHDGLGNVTSVRRSCGQTDHYEFDMFGQLCVHQDSRGGRVVLSWGPEGTLSSISDPSGRLHSYSYDGLGRVVKQEFFDGRVEHYQYGADGELARIMPEGAEPAELTYDEVRLLVDKRSGTAEPDTFAYDPLRQLLQFNGPEVAVSFEYDGEGNVVAEQQGDQLVEFEYDSAGICLGWKPKGAPAVSFACDRRGRISQMRDEQIGTFQFACTASDELARIEYPGGMKLEYTYDQRGNVISQSLSRGGSLIWNRQYGYDASCRLIDIQSNRGRVSYEYDSADQLRRVRRAADEESYSYGAAGDVDSVNGSPVGRDEFGRWVSCRELAVKYSGSGLPSVLNYGGHRYELEWDREARLSRCADETGTCWELAYDMAARLIWCRRGQRLTEYLWCGSLLHARFVNGRLDERYLYHPQLGTPVAVTGPRGTLWLVPDFRGQPVAAVTESGELIEYDYSAFGRLRPGRPTQPTHPFRLPGQLALEDLPFHYNRFRYFLPEVGRFLTPDPLGLEAGINLVGWPGNPIQGVDLVGLCDGEVFYRAMSDEELKAVMKDCQIHNRPESESKCHEAFVTQRKDYSEKLQERHPDKYPNLVEFCCQKGTASAMQNPAISAASNSRAASRMFPSHSRVIKGLTNKIHLKFEQVSSPSDQALNYGLRRDSAGTFNKRVKSAKAQPGGQSCSR